MNIKHFITTIALFLGLSFAIDATIKITSFQNESPIALNDVTDDGRPYLEQIKNEGGFIVGEEGATISSKDGKYQFVFEDAGKSGFHRPYWKFHVWVKMIDGFPFMAGGKVLHAVFFYDGLGDMQVRLCPGSKLFIKGGRDVLYPWKVGTKGRGNPYHKIDHDKADDNGVTYFDADGFVAYPYNSYEDAP